MTIKKAIDYILEHPFTKDALIKCQNGDDEDLRYMLFIAIKHTNIVTTSNCLKVYRQNKRTAPNLIIEAFKNITPIENLSIELPIPLIKTEQPVCKVVIMKVKLPKSWKDPKQLELEFKERLTFLKKA